MCCLCSLSLSLSLFGVFSLLLLPLMSWPWLALFGLCTHQLLDATCGCHCVQCGLLMPPLQGAASRAQIKKGKKLRPKATEHVPTMVVGLWVAFLSLFCLSRFSRFSCLSWLSCLSWRSVLLPLQGGGCPVGSTYPHHLLCAWLSRLSCLSWLPLLSLCLGVFVFVFGLVVCVGVAFCVVSVLSLSLSLSSVCSLCCCCP